MFGVLAQHTLISHCCESPWDRSMAGVNFPFALIKEKFMFKFIQAVWWKQLNFNYQTEA